MHHGQHDDARFGAGGWLLAITMLGLAMRLVAGTRVVGMAGDLETYAAWSERLVTLGAWQFYDPAARPETDHLPGDLWVLFGLAKLFRALGGEDFHGAGYRLLIKAVPCLADLLVATILYRIVARYRSRDTATLAFAAYLLNPAAIMVGAVWGQWDAVSMGVLLAGMWIAVAHERRWLLAVPLLAWAVTIKPPLAIAALLILLIPLWPLIERAAWPGLARRALAAGAIGIVTVLVLIVPFDTGLPGMGFGASLLDRIRFALDLYPMRTMSAANLWMLGQGRLVDIPDSGTVLPGMSAYTLGNVLLAAALAGILVMLVWWLRRVGAGTAAAMRVVAWGQMATSMAIYLLPTRVHERYLFPVVVFSVLYAALAGFPGLEVTLAVVLSAVYTLNLDIVLTGFGADLPKTLYDFARGPAMRWLSIANIAVFLLMLALPWIQRAPAAGSLAHRAPDASRCQRTA